MSKDKDTQLIWESYSTNNEKIEDDYMEFADENPSKDKSHKNKSLKLRRPPQGGGHEHTDTPVAKPKFTSKEISSLMGMKDKTPKPAKIEIKKESSRSTGDGFEELSLQELFTKVLEVDQSLAPDVKQSEDYTEIVYMMKRNISSYLEELELKVQNVPEFDPSMERDDDDEHMTMNNYRRSEGL